MIIIGLDPSTHTGYSIIDTELGTHVVGEVEFPKLTGMSRLAAFQRWWQEVLEQHFPDLVIIEGYGFSGSALSQMVELGTVFRLWCYFHEVPYLEVAPSSLKKFATGKGVGAKELVMMHVLKTWGYESATNNIADAYVLSKIGEAINDPSLPWVRAHHREVVAVVTSTEKKVRKKKLNSSSKSV